MINPRLAGAVALVLLVAVGLTGCCPCDKVVTFNQDLPSTCSVTTASAEAARAHEGEATLLSRGYEPMPVFVPAGGVTHFPTYLEGPTEVACCETSLVAWSGRDWRCIVSSPVRFLLNTALTPIMMCVEPPWQKMVSDGQCSRCGCLRRDAVAVH